MNIIVTLALLLQILTLLAYSQVICECKCCDTSNVCQTGNFSEATCGNCILSQCLSNSATSGSCGIAKTITVSCLTFTPTTSPTFSPLKPTVSPTYSPTLHPSLSPTKSPLKPTVSPTASPTNKTNPTNSPVMLPGGGSGWSGTYQATSVCNQAQCCCLNQTVTISQTGSQVSVSGSVSGQCGAINSANIVFSLPSSKTTGSFVFNGDSYTIINSGSNITITSLNNSVCSEFLTSPTSAPSAAWYFSGTVNSYFLIFVSLSLLLFF